MIMARREKFSVGQLTVDSIVNQFGSSLMPGVNPSGGIDYFVDLNTANGTKDGLSWDTSVPLIATAITKSNASIGLASNRFWARRNRIFVQGDVMTESLTVLPEKCDIIGVGTDLRPFPRVYGNHTIALAKVGCRFINMGFVTTGTGDLFVIPAGSHGLQFVGCTFEPGSTSTKALEITDSAHVRITDCRFTVGAGDISKIFAVAISIEGNTCHDVVIQGNQITATSGVCVTGTSSVAAVGSLIADNYIRAVALAIDDDSDDFQVINNRWITDINTATSTAGYDFNLQLACGNIQMGATGLGDSIPFLKIAES
jgi:hypothetical protein